MSITTKPDTAQLAEDLREIQLEIIEALERAKRLIRQAPQMTRLRAESYWLAHARTAITKDHDYLGGSMVTMEDTINEIESEQNDDPS